MDLFVGQRVILDDEHIGTIRFNGTVEDQVWLGVEWDNPTRGKHSGQFKEGPILFNTIVPNSATFIKPSKRIKTGRSFLTALKEKYLDLDLLVNSGTPIQQESSSSCLDIEDRIGLHKIALQFSQFDQLRLIGLELSQINGAGNEEEIDGLNGLLPSVETLNLSCNLFSDLHEVFKIVSKQPKLKELILSSNRFQFIPDRIPSLPSLEILNLDSTLLSWNQALFLVTQIPTLIELSLSNCRIQNISLLGHSHHHHLSVLNLDQNGLTNWHDLMRILHLLFPRLETLNLRRNQLKITPITKDESLVSIKHLSLVGNQIENGTEIDELRDWIPNLTSLYLTGNPLYDTQDVKKNRLLVLARYPSLTQLDGSQVRATERTEADLFYWSLIQKESIDHDQRIKEHRRYPELLSSMTHSSFSFPCFFSLTLNP
ncbi:hypothetical protein MJO29_008614 [Puccinia striiformis f. sp. tritici]|nr:hypothetical protein MJO29_008614 [Puccinia striiformis f. sp. tritici]